MDRTQCLCPDVEAVLTSWYPPWFLVATFFAGCSDLDESKPTDINRCSSCSERVSSNLAWKIIHSSGISRLSAVDLDHFSYFLASTLIFSRNTTCQIVPRCFFWFKIMIIMVNSFKNTSEDVWVGEIAAPPFFYRCSVPKENTFRKHLRKRWVNRAAGRQSRPPGKTGGPTGASAGSPSCGRSWTQRASWDRPATTWNTLEIPGTKHQKSMDWEKMLEKMRLKHVETMGFHISSGSCWGFLWMFLYQPSLGVEGLRA